MKGTKSLHHDYSNRREPSVFDRDPFPRKHFTTRLSLFRSIRTHIRKSSYTMLCGLETQDFGCLKRIGMSSADKMPTDHLITG